MDFMNEFEMGKTEDFKTESLAFAGKVGLVKYYDQEKWFSGAYSTLNARFTIIGGGLSEESKKTVRGLLFFSIEELKSFSVGDYDKWFYELAKKITDSNSKLSFGHAQKMINILMKYHFVYYYSNFNQNWKGEHSWLIPYFSHFHAPIDRKVLHKLTQYLTEIPANKSSWTKWQWTDKGLYKKLQGLIQALTERSESYHNNRLYFEMTELWKSDTKKTPQQKMYYGKKEIIKRVDGENSIKNFLEETISEINKQSNRTFELNDTTGYFSIALSGAKRNKNVVCFVKNEPVISLNINANISKSFLEISPFNKLKKRDTPPRGLQLRPDKLDRYPHNVEYNLKTDKEIIFQLCKKACDNFLH